MFKIIKNKREQGNKTSPYPKEPVNLYHRFRGMPIINKGCRAETIAACIALCPQDCIDGKSQTIDLGRCTFCGQCATVDDGAFVTFSQNFELGAANRNDLIIDSAGLPILAERSKAHFKKLFGRSLQLRQVSAGGCNSCEADTNVLNTPFFDLSRFGIDFVASPRHADGLHVTGPVTKNMKHALITAYDAVSSPKVVIASGACSISGGPFYGSTEIVGDLSKVLPVDLYIPGCPPHPMTTLHALLNFFK